MSGSARASSWDTRMAKTITCPGGAHRLVGMARVKHIRPGQHGRCQNGGVHIGLCKLRDGTLTSLGFREKVLGKSRVLKAEWLPVRRAVARQGRASA